MSSPIESKEQLRSNRIDRILTGKYTAIPAFVGIMALVFYLTFGVIGSGLQDLLAAGIDRLTTLTDNALDGMGTSTRRCTPWSSTASLQAWAAC